MEMNKSTIYSPLPPVNRSVSLVHLSTPLVHSCSKMTSPSQTKTSSEGNIRYSTDSLSVQPFHNTKKTSLLTETCDCSMTDSSKKFWNSRFSDSQLNVINYDKDENLESNVVLKESPCTDLEISCKEKLGTFIKRHDLDTKPKDKTNRWAVNNVNSKCSLNSACKDSLANNGTCFCSGRKRFGVRIDVDFISLPEDVSDDRNYEISPVPQNDICKHTHSNINCKFVDAKTRISMFEPLCIDLENRRDKTGGKNTEIGTFDLRLKKTCAYSPEADKHYKVYNTVTEDEASIHAHEKQCQSTDKNHIDDQNTVVKLTDIKLLQQETTNDGTAFESVEMKGTKNNVHIRKAKCSQQVQIKQKPMIECMTDSNPSSRVHSAHFTHETKGKQYGKDHNSETRTDARNHLLTCNPDRHGNRRHRKPKESQGIADTRINLPLYQLRHTRPVTTRGIRYTQGESISTGSVDENVIDENCVWIKRTQDLENLLLQGVDDSSGETSVERARESPAISSLQPRIVMFLTLLGSLLNPVFAPAGIYFLIRSKKAWSLKQYHTAYRFSYQASGIAIIGIIVTITSLVLFMLTVGPRAHIEATKSSHILTTTSGENQELSDIRSAGERFLQTIMNSSSSDARNEKLTTRGRNARRTVSPRRSYTNVRHSTHRFGNIPIDDFNNMVNQITPTETPETTRAEHFSAFFNAGVSRRKTRLLFRNETMAVYFDPGRNITKIVNIPDFLQ